jgi:hypothetical protein
VGFLINFDYLKWLGGTYVIKHLIYCINTFSRNEIEPILIVKKKLSKREIIEFKEFKLIRTNLFHNQNFIKKIYNKFLVIFFGKSRTYESFFIKNKINVLSHINVFSTNIILGKKSSIKSLPFIADFQHIHYPENFSFKSRLMRNINTILCSIHSSKILLCSFDAKNDLKRISKTGHKKSVVSQFIFKIPKKKDIINLSSLKKKFNFHSHFFYVPNQYWIHKNHIIILEAIKYIKKKYKLNKLLILSTGYNEDYRNKNHFIKIKKFILKNNLQNNYKYLGVVTFNEVLSLMYHSIAIINPSKFEGRSSTVEQAKSMGKKIILSNIAIHKEQNPDRGIYFNPDKFLELSSILVKTWNKYNYISDKKFINKASKKNENNLLKYYKNYRKIVTSLI